MKDLKNKVAKATKRVTLGAIDSIAMPLHMVVIGTGDLVKASTDMIGQGIANAEGYLVSKVDKSRDAKEVAKKRLVTTDMAFIAAGHKVKDQADNIRAFLDKSKQDIKASVTIIRDEVKHLINPADNQHIEFDIANLKKQREDVLADTSLDEGEQLIQVRAINRKIGDKRKLLNVIPTATPAEAFAPAGS